ncbi:hypothetical protein NZNM25_14090 [Nitrosopumilus zosterae]|uniref:Peptidase n=1 Tax=Nitrosopumilus zosterae TaxID=718286 RepID=A0A2S2KT31_9ARCH|nr:hypothetical protein [Nitrosopumilus zosterae]BDQ30767.1 hypothetical protein NZOSNM25_000875 [Nitrosopumilus zosterae]GBH34618.1 hypothetical protein NZNM25_14090 [Nitrosopumilus zosterae]
MKTVIWGILGICIIFSFNAQSAFAHTPDFEITTTKDILKFCEFFYEEYQLLGIYDLTLQHPQFPNLRACAILYNHVAWNSTHEARNVVLIAEIEKYLGDSSYIKDRHIVISDIIPDWAKREARLWVNGENQDVGFAYVVRTMLEAGILKLDFIEKNCDGDEICMKEGDFIKYSHFDKFGNISTIKHTVKSIINEEITLTVEKTSDEGKIKEEITLEKNGLIKNDECCKYYEFVIPTQISLGDKISNNLKIVSETTHIFENQMKQSWYATDTTGQNTKVIDKNTGLVFLYEHHETTVLSVGEKTKITDTNFFDSKYNVEEHQIKIPDWLKKTTAWLLDKRIPEEEYLRAIENLISRNIIKV